jgi:hypothetical protein
VAGEYYRVETARAVLGIDYLELLNTLLAGGMPTALAGVVSAAAEDEPYTVLAADAGRQPGDPSAPVVMVELSACQVDYGLSEMPQATAQAELGRALHLISGGVEPGATVSIAEVLERYLGDARVPCRLYAAVVPGPWAGVRTPEDALTPPAETQVLFDGYLVGASGQAAAGGRRVLTLALTHFLSDLAASSAVTAQISAASARGLAFNASLSPYIVVPAASVQNPGAVVQTPYGAAQIAVGSGKAMEADFWGWWQPPVSAGAAEEYGVHHFLYAIARQDLFGDQALRNQALGAAACPPPAVGAKPNALALPALRRIEPFSDVTAENPTGLRGSWGQIRNAVVGLLAAEAGGKAFGLAPGFDRQALLAVAAGAYTAVGYRYGMPVPFRKSDIGHGVFSPSYGFAADLANETVANLGPSSMWDKLVGQYLPRYGLALAPLSTRAVVMPLCPAIRKTWQTVYASDVGQVRSSTELPVLIRGVVLLGRRPSPTGAMAGVSPDDARARNYEHFLAAYDSCRTGQFVFREAPAWLAAAAVLPPALAAVNLAAPFRAAANSPATVRKARDGVFELLAANPDVLNEFGAVLGGAASVDLASRALSVPIGVRLGMAHAYAKALYQYERLRGRSFEVAGRFRTDIGPGSTVAVEVPADAGVDAALGLPPSRKVYGVVQRVSVVISCAGAAHATTSLRLGFVRREAELAADSDLSADGHPVWGSVVPGVPLVDSLWMRTRLANRARLDT